MPHKSLTQNAFMERNTEEGFDLDLAGRRILSRLEKTASLPESALRTMLSRYGMPAAVGAAAGGVTGAPEEKLRGAIVGGLGGAAGAAALRKLFLTKALAANTARIERALAPETKAALTQARSDLAVGKSLSPEATDLMVQTLGPQSALQGMATGAAGYAGGHVASDTDRTYRNLGRGMHGKVMFASFTEPDLEDLCQLAACRYALQQSVVPQVMEDFTEKLGTLLEKVGGLVEKQAGPKLGPVLTYLPGIIGGGYLGNQLTKDPSHRMRNIALGAGLGTAGSGLARMAYNKLLSPTIARKSSERVIGGLPRKEQIRYDDILQRKEIIDEGYPSARKGLLGAYDRIIKKRPPPVTGDEARLFDDVNRRIDIPDMIGEGASETIGSVGGLGILAAIINREQKQKARAAARLGVPQAEKLSFLGRDVAEAVAAAGKKLTRANILGTAAGTALGAGTGIVGAKMIGNALDRRRSNKALSDLSPEQLSELSEILSGRAEGGGL
jgi:hypothetical protein